MVREILVRIGLVVLIIFLHDRFDEFETLSALNRFYRPAVSGWADAECEHGNVKLWGL